MIRTQEKEILVVMIHTSTLELCLPGQKIKKTDANKLGSLMQPPAHDISRVLGR